MHDLDAQADVAPGTAAPPRPMTRDQVGSLARSGVEFGSHTVTHASLPALDSASKAREVFDSLAACEALTGARPRTFAYPFGDFDAQSEALVEQAGFLCACTTRNAPVDRRSGRFALPRLHVGAWPAGMLKQKLGA